MLQDTIPLIFLLQTYVSIKIHELVALKSWCILVAKLSRGKFAIRIYLTLLFQYLRNQDVSV